MIRKRTKSLTLKEINDAYSDPESEAQMVEDYLRDTFRKGTYTSGAFYQAIIVNNWLRWARENGIRTSVDDPALRLAGIRLRRGDQEGPADKGQHPGA